MSIRISAAPIAKPDPVGELLATDDSQAFLYRVRALATRPHYADTAESLRRIVEAAPETFTKFTTNNDTRKAHLRDDYVTHNLIGSILDNSRFKLLRVMRFVGLVKSHRKLIDFICFEDLTRYLDDPDKAHLACVVFAVFGVVNGRHWSWDQPLPDDRRERAALALNLLLRAFYGGVVLPP